MKKMSMIMAAAMAGCLIAASTSAAKTTPVAPTKAGPAIAFSTLATGPSYTWSPTGWSNIRNYCPSTSCGILVSVPNGTAIYMHCWVDAQWAYGAYWTNRWFFAGVLTRYGEDITKVGWIHASLVRNQDSVPHC